MGDDIPDDGLIRSMIAGTLPVFGERVSDLADFLRDLAGAFPEHGENIPHMAETSPELGYETSDIGERLMQSEDQPAASAPFCGTF